ncbi:MAG: septal ring lytic transglycosylase RlpA family protein [Candidatus Omnitrophota bacterium]
MDRKTKVGLIILFLLPLVISTSCSVHKRDVVVEPDEEETTESQWYSPGQLIETGVASWYGDDFHGKRTSDGEIYDMDKLTAAHQTLPFHSLLMVENVENKKKTIVRINDRGPFVKNRIIDLSREAAKRIGIFDIGTALVRLWAIKLPGPGKKWVPQPNTATTVYLQAGAFGSKKNAERVLRQIKDALPDTASLFKVESQKGFYKIISKEMGFMEADSLSKRLKAKGFDSLILN